MGPNKKTSRAHPGNPRPPKTIACIHCGEAIVVPKTCQHGKKLNNCRGTECSKAHIQEHNTKCPKQASDPTVSKPTSKGPPTKGLDQNQHRLQQDQNDELQILILLIKEEIVKIECSRGKPVKYLEGIPKEEWIKNLSRQHHEQNDGGQGQTIPRAREWAHRLKDAAEGMRTFEQIEYDDDESDLDGGGCLTPPEEE